MGIFLNELKLRQWIMSTKTFRIIPAILVGNKIQSGLPKTISLTGYKIRKLKKSGYEKNNILVFFLWDGPFSKE
jgi:hypothetical protein